MLEIFLDMAFLGRKPSLAFPLSPKKVSGHFSLLLYKD